MYPKLNLSSAAGSYVALTVLGRPPGLVQIPLGEGEGDPGLSPSLSSPHSPGPTSGESRGLSPSSTTTSPQDHITPLLPLWVRPRVCCWGAGGCCMCMHVDVWESCVSVDEIGSVCRVRKIQDSRYLLSCIRFNPKKRE